MNTYEDVPMFDVDLPVRKTPPGPQVAGRPRWSKYRPQTAAKCDDCMQTLLLTRGEAPAALPAKWRRAQGGTTQLLCFPHAQERRDIDGLDKLED